MELRDYWKIVKRRVKIVIAITILVIFSYAILIIFFRQEKYIATSSIMINPPSIQQYVTSKLAPASPPLVMMLPQNQLRMMQSWNMAKLVSEEIEKKEKYKISPDEIFRSQRIYLEEKTIIKIEISSSSKKNAKLIANYYALVSVAENEKLSEDEYSKGVEFIENKSKDYLSKLEDVNQKMEKINREFSTLDFNAEVLSKINRLSNYQATIENLHIQKEEIYRTINQLQKQLQYEGKTLTITEEIPNPELQNYKNQLYPLEVQLAEMQDYYTEEHPKIISLKQKIENLDKKIKTKIAKTVSIPKEIENPKYHYLTQSLLNQEMNLISLQVKEKALADIIKKEEQGLFSLSEEDKEYAKLLREKQTIEKQYNTLQEILENMRINQAMKTGNTEVLELSRDATEIPRTNPQQFIFVIVVGFIVGVTFGIIFEFLDDTVKTPYEVKKYLNLTTFGTVPKIKEYDFRLISNLSTKSPLTEIYNKIAYHIQKNCLDIGAKTILITSAKEGEGKSTIIANLGLSLARTGEKIMIVDSDLRKPILHRIFNISNAYGLTSLITGEAQANIELQRLIDEDKRQTSPSYNEIIEKFIQKNTQKNLSILTSGPMITNPVEILTKQDILFIIEYCKKNYTKILFDSPPLLSVIDAAILASHLDGIILTLDASSIKRGEANRAKQILVNLKIKILGVILNNVEVEEEYYYYYRSYSPYRRKYH